MPYIIPHPPTAEVKNIYTAPGYIIEICNITERTAIYNYGVGYIFNYASKGEDGKIIIVNQHHQPLLGAEGGKEKEDTPLPGREKCRAVRERSGKSRIPLSWKDPSSTDNECI